MRIPFLVYAAMAIALSLPRVSAAPANVKLIRSDDRVRVEIAGQLFTEYIFRGASRPYLYPVVAADGTRLTRDFPMKKSAEEDQDHPHHRSLWFAHSDVNGVDFWNEDDAGSRRPKGKIIHEQLLEPSRDSSNLIQARSRWVAPDGKVFCTDETRIGFGALGDTRLIDFQVTLLAPADASVQLGDNKDGVIALRLAQWLNLPRPPATGRKFTGGQGHIVNANGDRDGAAWGKRAPWCDFYAEHGSKTYGIAVFDHPQNLRHPTWWHARDYGLFAANPIGWHDFEAKQTKVGAGNYVIPAGGSLTLRYRIYIHSGNEKDAKLAQHYAEYAAEK
jgi:hypothetical protein